jgi:hypothetical protein
MTTSLMFELRVALTLVFRLACLNEPLLMVLRLGSFGTSIPISCLIRLIRIFPLLLLRIPVPRGVVELFVTRQLYKPGYSHIFCLAVKLVIMSVNVETVFYFWSHESPDP